MRGRTALVIGLMVLVAVVIQTTLFGRLRIVTPDVVMPVGPFHEEIPADVLLDELDGRIYSSQWEVPEALHQQVMAALRDAWAGRELSRSYSMAITFWRVERIAAFARSRQMS